MNNPSQIIKSVSYDQTEILNNILHLNGISTFDADLTFGNGGFYKAVPKPKIRIDIDANLPDINHEGTSTRTGLGDHSVGSLVFDPPFLTYVKAAREHNSIMAKRFGGYWRYDELEEHYKDTLTEASRVLKRKGIMVFKCQDIIHNHKLHCTHVNVINWASDRGFRLKDMFILTAKSRMGMPEKPNEAKRKQRHARVFHSYFLVLEKV